MNKIMKKVSMLCITSLLFSSISAPVMADTYIENSNLYAMTQDAMYVPLKISQQIAQYYLDTVYQEEQIEKNDIYTVTNEYNSVYNVDNQLIGYLFRILNNSNEEIGYIITGNNNEVPTVFEACLGDVFTKHLEEAEKLYYISPLNIAIKTDGELISIQNNKPIDLSNINSMVRRGKQNNKEEKKNEWDTLLSVLNNQSVTTSAQLTLNNTRAAHTIYSVYNEPDFVNISDRYYGGNQSWYTSPYKTGNSCGPVAAANLMAYFAKEYPSYADVYPYSDILDSYFHKANFLKHMNKMYDYLNPTIIGVASISQFRSGLNKYIYDLTGGSISYKDFRVSTYSTLVNGTIGGLKQKAPVALLVLDIENGGSGNLEGSQGDSFAMHWITITKYFKDGNTSSEQIAFSSWGLRYSVPLYDFWYMYDIEGGIYYYY
jgi:hypothetical protein